MIRCGKHSAQRIRPIPLANVRAKLGFASLFVICALSQGHANSYESGGKVDEFVGAYTETIPITVPPFHGIEPKLSLQYHSGRGSGLLGVGWSLQGLSVIERTDGMYSGVTPMFELDGQLLVECSRHTDWTPAGQRSPACELRFSGTPADRLGASNVTLYSTLSESYLRIGHGTDPVDQRDTFVVWKPDGVAHSYKLAPGNTGRWLLSKVVDARGNTVEYSWHGRPAKTFNAPRAITYNGTVISFGYMTRARPETYAEQGLLESLDEVLVLIDVCVGDPMNPSPCNTAGVPDPRRARAYGLQYGNSRVSSRPLLGMIQVFGKNAAINGSVVTGGTSAPAITMAWSNPIRSSHVSLDPTPIWNWGRVGGMVDFDGDGRADYCRDDTGNPSANMRCALSRGATVADTWVGQVADLGNDSSSQWVDWNGDGRTDFCRIVLRDVNGGPWDVTDGARSYRLWCAFSTGTGMTDMQVGPPLPDGQHGQQKERWFVDWNGDGRVDYCRAFQTTAAGNRILGIKCAFSTGTSYSDRQVGAFDDLYDSLSLDDVLGHPETRAVADWNGDGRADLCRVAAEFVGPFHGTRTGKQVLKCLFGSVDEFDRDTFPASNATYHDRQIGEIPDRGSANTQWWVDVNGDGKSDYCRLLGSTVIQCAVSRQRSLQDVKWAESPAKFGTAESRQWGDIDGDGAMDMCFDGPTAMKSCVISRGLAGTVIDTGVIRKSIDAPNRHWLVDWDGDGRVDYCFNSDSAGEGGSNLTCVVRDANTATDRATVFENGIGGKTTVSYSPSQAFAPSHVKLFVVASVTTEGGAEGPVTRTYQYGAPSFDAWSRRFLGFGLVRVTDPCIAAETVCPFTEIASRIDWRWPTAPARISRYANGVQVVRQDLVYADTSLRPYRSDVVEQKRTEYDGIDSITTRRTFTYDRYGNVTRLDDFGVVADTTGYFGNLAADDRWLITQFTTNPQVYLNNKPFSITGHDASGQLTDVRYTYDDHAWRDIPTRGLATKTEVWLDTSATYLESRAIHDEQGNVTLETDRNQNVTTYQIDDTYRVYIVKTTLPAAGTPPVAQSMSTPLAHWDVQCGVKLRETHDQNGATTVNTHDPLCRKIRTDLPGGGWETIDYRFGGNGSYTEVSQPGSRWRRTTFDGLGRVARISRSGGIIEKEITYDRRGNVATATRPRYDGAPAYRHAYAYDGRDREIAAVLPWATVDGRWQPGDSKLTRYKLMTTITEDAMGHTEMTVRDVRGRRVMSGSTDGTVTPRDLTRYVYDRRGNLERIEQPAQRGASMAITSYVYDSLGRKTSVRESNAGTRTFSHDANGNVIVEVDTTSQVTTRFWYDARDRRIAKVAPFCGLNSPCGDSVRTEWRFDEPRGGHKNVGHLTSMIDASGTATYDYDLAGNLVRGGRTVDGSQPYTFAKQYDVSGRLLATTYPDGSTVGTATQPIEYDLAGRVSRIPGIVRTATYDAADQLTSYTAPSGAKATYETANPRGTIASYTYEGSAPVGSTAMLGDFEGANTASATTKYTEIEILPALAAGQTITVSTCAAGVPHASGAGDTFLRLFWTPAGGAQLIELASNDNSYVPGCGALSTITHRATSGGRFFVRAGCAANTGCSGTIAARLENDGANLALNRTVHQSSGLDAACGPPQSVVDDNPQGIWCSRSSMLHTQRQPQPWMMIDLGSDQDISRIDVFNRSDTNICDATCLARLSNFDIMVLADGGSGGWRHVATVSEQARWPTSVHVARRARVVFLRLRGTDYLNTPEVRVVGAGRPGAVLANRPVFARVTIARDLEGRIARIDSNLARSSWNYGYSFDNSHELWSADNQGDATLSKSSSSDNGNIYFDNLPATYGYGPGALPHALTQFHNTQLVYEADGHMTSAQSRGDVAWTRTRQLVGFGGVSYAYDGDGYRLRKTYNGETRIYLGDDYEISSAGHTKYISLGGRLVAKQMGTAPATTLFTDQLGSVVLGLDGAGALAFKASYGPWGETRTGAGNGRGYTGQYMDENGLLYLHARFYDPSIGRFISPDPVISSPHPIGVNRYAYAFNDPINHSDIDGLGGIADANNALTNAMGLTAQFLATTNVVDHLEFYSKELGLGLPVRNWMGGFNFGIGNTLALTFVKFHALGRADYAGFGKALASEVVVSAAVAATLLAPAVGPGVPALVSVIVGVRLPYYLTLIETGDPWAAHLAFRDAAFGTIKGDLLFNQPVAVEIKQRIKQAMKDGPPIGDAFYALYVLSIAEPYVVMKHSDQAIALAPQSRLASGSGTLFGYGYRGAGRD